MHIAQFLAHQSFALSSDTHFTYRFSDFPRVVQGALIVALEVLFASFSLKNKYRSQERGLQVVFAWVREKMCVGVFGFGSVPSTLPYVDFLGSAP